MAGIKKENIGWIVAVVGIVIAIALGIQNAGYKKKFAQIGEDTGYVKDNVYYKVAPRGIKEKIENIRTLCGCAAEAPETAAVEK